MHSYVSITPPQQQQPPEAISIPDVMVPVNRNTKELVEEKL